MAWSGASEVATDDSAAGDDGLAAQDDILRSRYRRPARDFVTRVLPAR